MLVLGNLSRGNPPVLCIAGRWMPRLLVVLPEPLYIIAGNWIALRRRINPVQPRRIQAEDLGLNFGTKRRITKALHQHLRHLESSQGFNLPLWRSPPD